MASGVSTQSGGTVATRLVWRWPGFAGCLGALPMFGLSLTPSLLPRPWMLQALLTGILMALGYAAGSGIAAVVRRRWAIQPGTLAWAGLAGVGFVLAVGLLPLAGQWQQEHRESLGQPAGEWPWPLILAAALLLAAGLVLASRMVRWVVHRLTRALDRHHRRPVAAAVTAVAVVAVGGPGLGVGALLPGLSAAAERMPLDAAADPGGEFRAGGDVQAVRVYVDLADAPTPTARAELALRRLDQAGGWQRPVLGVIVPTGTGWVNPHAAESLEQVAGGDVALVAVRYSRLPSWVSFLTEQAAAEAEADALLTAVADRLAQMPEAQRPRVLVYGESLGARAGQAALAQLGERAGLFDGALLVGVPFGHRPEENLPIRVRYLEHADDPVVRWDPRLLYRPPEDGGLQPARWYPVVTFWQVTVDLLTSTQAPDGHGHTYRTELVTGWADLLAAAARPGSPGDLHRRPLLGLSEPVAG